MLSDTFHFVHSDCAMFYLCESNDKDIACNNVFQLVLYSTEFYTLMDNKIYMYKPHMQIAILAISGS